MNSAVSPSVRCSGTFASLNTVSLVVGFLFIDLVFIKTEFLLSSCAQSSVWLVYGSFTFSSNVHYNPTCVRMFITCW